MKNFNKEDYDLEKLFDFQKEKLIETSNFKTIKETCLEALKYSRMTAIIGEPGYGKTKSLENFARNNKNVYMITVKKTMSSKNLYTAILEQAGWTNVYKESTIYNIIESIGYYLKETGGNHLIIVDEAGKLSHKNLLLLHDLRDSTAKNTGVVIAGPQYFETNLYSMEKKRIEGIQEVVRRISAWIHLERPSLSEKREVCKIYGIKNQSIISELVNNSEHLSELYFQIENLALFALREKNGII